MDRRFTRDQLNQLNKFLQGAGARQYSQRRKRALVHALLAALRQTAMETIPTYGTVSLTKLEKAVGHHYQELSQEYRSLLADELTRRGFPENHSGMSAVLDYCIAELNRTGHSVSQISETARQLVSEILDEGGVFGKGTVYELVVEKIDTGSWQQNGLLGLLGYKVGKSGLGLNERRTILRDAYRVLLVPGSQEVAEYLSSWGSPRSEQRFDKITGSLGRFMALARNQRADYSSALADWQTDLDWLLRSGRTR